MNDVGTTLETETPVNPYSLLEAVNHSSDSVNRAWLLYLALLSYVLITVAGISHRDLLLNSEVVLPILQVKIDLLLFFMVAPVLLVLVHLGMLGQLALLARKTLEFKAALRMLEPSDQRTHPLRLALDNFFFVQAIAGPERSRIMGILLHGISWLTLVLMPVLVLLYVQLAFLPYHDAGITWLHRAALLADMLLLVLLGVFALRSETTFFRALSGTGLRHAVSSLATVIVLVIVAVFSLFVATIPGEAVHRLPPSASEQRQSAERGSGPYFLGYAAPAFGATAEGLLFGLFHRNLNVVDQDLVDDKDASPAWPTINLRRRDLRYARLDRTDLHQADLTGADLEGASMVGADLRHAWLHCVDPLGEIPFTDNRRAAKCVNARGANFTRARMAEAKMTGIDLRGSTLEQAELQGAELVQGRMGGANFGGARLERANLSGGMLQATNFVLAKLQGADLSGAKLQFADLGNAALQGANLSLAALEGALLREADLEGANVQGAKLHGADLAGAKLGGIDMSGAVVWRTVPPGGDGPALADMAKIVLSPPGIDELTGLNAMVASINAEATKLRVSAHLATMAPEGDSAWGTSAEQQIWQGLSKSSEALVAEGYKSRLTDYLAKLMCRASWSDGAVATGIARRAMAPGFKGDILLIYDKLRAPDCPALARMRPEVMRNLAAAAEAARGQ